MFSVLHHNTPTGNMLAIQLFSPLHALCVPHAAALPVLQIAYAVWVSLQPETSMPSMVLALRCSPVVGASVGCAGPAPSLQLLLMWW
jgi:hypothetical protein